MAGWRIEEVRNRVEARTGPLGQCGRPYARQSCSNCKRALDSSTQARFAGCLRKGEADVCFSDVHYMRCATELRLAGAASCLWSQRHVVEVDPNGRNEIDVAAKPHWTSEALRSDSARTPSGFTAVLCVSPLICSKDTRRICRLYGTSGEPFVGVASNWPSALHRAL